MELADQYRDLGKRRLHGIYYTPDWLARPLTEWALKDNVGPVLDPSFGGCAFLNAALDELERLGEPSPGRYILGCDIDREAVPYANRLHSRGVPAGNIRFADFFSVSSQQWLRKRPTAVLGNPPYLRHHIMSDDAIDRAQQLISSCGAAIPRLASAWAYFTILATECIADDGRLALVLPGTILHAAYGGPILTILKRKFGSVRILHSQERLFRGSNAQEESVIVLAMNRGQTTSHIGYRHASTRTDLLAAITDGDRDGALGDSYKTQLLPAAVVAAYTDVLGSLGCAQLGDILDVRIGIVTGANKFFVRAPADPLFSSKLVNCVPIVHTARQLRQPVLTRYDFLPTTWASYLAVITGRGRTGSVVRSELDRAEANGIHLRYHTGKRPKWFQISDLDSPAAFFPYMTSELPRITRNASRALCTNAIHRLILRDRSAASREALDRLVVASYGSLFALEAEIFGRHYGGGVLKIEPSGLKRFSAWLPSITLSRSMTSTNLAEIADAAFASRFSAATLREIRNGRGILARHRRYTSGQV